MSRLNLSNLRVRANLLAFDHYQQEMLRCSVFELRDIKERNPNLINGMPPSKQEEWRESLFWGDRPPPPADAAWIEMLAGGLPEAIRDLEERPSLEAAFECLIVARQLYHVRADGPAKAAAADLDRRVCDVLARDEFRHTPDMIDQRLEGVLGRRLAGPPGPPGSPVEPHDPPRPVVRSRQPGLFPATVPAPAEAPTERPPVPPAAAVVTAVASDNGLVPQGEAGLHPPPNRPDVRPPVTPDRGDADSGREGPPPIRPDAEPPAAPPVKASPVPPAAARPTTTLTVRDPELKRLVQRWATLPDHVRKCVMMLLDAADATETATSE